LKFNVNFLSSAFVKSRLNRSTKRLPRADPETIKQRKWLALMKHRLKKRNNKLKRKRNKGCSPLTLAKFSMVGI
jgi:hypothetical protein